MTECAAVERTDETTTMQQSEEPEEDYSEGCFKENYMLPHVCPIPTGGWCRDYVKCKNMSVQRGVK